jgi:hypothetical protein
MGCGDFRFLISANEVTTFLEKRPTGSQCLQQESIFSKIFATVLNNGKERL